MEGEVNYMADVTVSPIGQADAGNLHFVCPPNLYKVPEPHPFTDGWIDHWKALKVLYIAKGVHSVVHSGWIRMSSTEDTWNEFEFTLITCSQEDIKCI